MTVASCRSAQISAIRRMIWREVFGSRLAVGSSTSSSSGSCSSARAMPTRWRWPPDSASARLSTCSVRPTRSKQLEGLVHVGLRKAAQQGSPERDVAQPARQHVLHHGQALDQGEFLEDHADAAARLAQAAARQAGELEVAQEHLAGGRLDQAVDAADQRRLAGAGGADQADDLARGDARTTRRSAPGRLSDSAW